MATDISTQLMTTDEFLQLADEEGVTRELIDGTLRERPVTTRSPKHSKVMTRISKMLDNWLDEQTAVVGVVACGEAPPEPPSMAPDEPPRPAAPESPPTAEPMTPRVRFEEPSTQPSYDSTALMIAVERRRVPIRRCFEILAVHDNIRPGRVVLSFTVRIDGTIGDSRTLEGGTYGDCVGEEIARLRLSQGPDGPVVVLLPMVFEETIRRGGG